MKDKLEAAYARIAGEMLADIDTLRSKSDRLSGRIRSGKGRACGVLIAEVAKLSREIEAQSRALEEIRCVLEDL